MESWSRWLGLLGKIWSPLLLLFLVSLPRWREVVGTEKLGAGISINKPWWSFAALVFRRNTRQSSSSILLLLVGRGGGGGSGWCSVASSRFKRHSRSLLFLQDCAAMIPSLDCRGGREVRRSGEVPGDDLPPLAGRGGEGVR